MDVSSLAALAQVQALNTTTASDSSSLTSSTDFSNLLSQSLTNNTAYNNSSTLGLMAGLSANQSSNNASMTQAFTQLLSAANTFAATAQQSGIDLSAVANLLGASTSLYNGSTSAYTPASVQSTYATTQSQPAITQTAASTATTKATASDSIASTSTGKATQYDAIIKKASVLYSIPEKMIKAVIQQESGFNTNATSSTGAKGLMQLMPSTAKYLGVNDSTNAEQNIMAGTKYLRQMLDKFGSYDLMLAGYNAGPGNVSKYGGVPPFKETQNYVSKIMANYNA
ncbi:lytic transglycosylase domain-containing protein [Kurthia senegalensis]|uniref:lytic transglycosylase domain-containing protein n=1 Tax=Kurthia senegalensis TaxID=1033740 RepID=UPI000289968E|nr:lytic transglycosylase domain-containing protein [Kurthia senegalensis]